MKTFDVLINRVHLFSLSKCNSQQQKKTDIVDLFFRKFVKLIKLNVLQGINMFHFIRL